MMKKGLALLLTLCLLLIPGCSSKKENVIKIVDGRVTEQKLVHRMIKMLVEDRTDLTVSIGEEMTAVNAYNEMKKRVYDVYMSYDGTVLTTFLHRDLTGAIPAAILALSLGALVDWIQKRLTPRGLGGKRG